MNLTFKQYLLEQTYQHDDFADQVMQIMGVTALSPDDRDVVHTGMQSGLSPEDVAGQLLNSGGMEDDMERVDLEDFLGTDHVEDLPPELRDPEGMPTGGGMGITGA